MPLHAFLSIVSSLLGFFGAILFALGVVRMTPDTIAQLSLAYMGYNETWLKNLISQKCDFICGMVLLALAFIAQFVSFLFKDNQVICTDYYCGLIFGCLLGVSIFVIILLIRIMMISPLKRKQKIALARQNLLSELEYLITKGTAKPGGAANILAGYNTLEEDAKMLLNFIREPEESKEQFFRRYANFLKINIPVGVNLNNLQ